MQNDKVVMAVLKRHSEAISKRYSEEKIRRDDARNDKHKLAELILENPDMEVKCILCAISAPDAVRAYSLWGPCIHEYVDENEFVVKEACGRLLYRHDTRYIHDILYCDITRKNPRKKNESDNDYKSRIAALEEEATKRIKWKKAIFVYVGER